MDGLLCKLSFRLLSHYICILSLLMHFVKHLSTSIIILIIQFSEGGGGGGGGAERFPRGHPPPINETLTLWMYMMKNKFPCEIYFNPFNHIKLNCQKNILTGKKGKLRIKYLYVGGGRDHGLAEERQHTQTEKEISREEGEGEHLEDTGVTRKLVTQSRVASTTIVLICLEAASYFACRHSLLVRDITYWRASVIIICCFY